MSLIEEDPYGYGKFKETRNYVQRVLENYNVYRYILEQRPIKMVNFFKDKPLF